MLNKPVTKFEFGEDGKVCGVTSGKETFKTKMVICTPLYCIKAGLKDKVKRKGSIIRCICILNNPIPNTNDVSAC